MDLAKTLITIIDERRKVGVPFFVAIDGPCGSGKTTLAKNILSLRDYAILPMDDFFLRPEQRTEERLKTPGENVDHERVLSVLKAIKEKGKASYQPYDCHAKKLLAPVFVPKKDVLLVEGSYSQHPSLVPYYDLKVFLDIDPTEQLRHLEKRVGKERLLDFIHR